MKTTAVVESLSYYKTKYCSREYQFTSRFIQQYEKSTSIVESHFDSLDLRNAIVPFMTPSASHDTDADTNVITWPKSHVAPLFSCLFQLSSPNETNGAIGESFNITWQQCLYQWHHTNKKSHVSPHFHHCHLMNEMVPFTKPLAQQRYFETLFRHCLGMCRYIKTCLSWCRQSRQCPDMQTHLDIVWTWIDCTIIDINLEGSLWNRTEI